MIPGNHNGSLFVLFWANLKIYAVVPCPSVTVIYYRNYTDLDLAQYNIDSMQKVRRTPTGCRRCRVSNAAIHSAPCHTGTVGGRQMSDDTFPDGGRGAVVTQGRPLWREDGAVLCRAGPEVR